jgi:hypothetical protein
MRGSLPEATKGPTMDRDQYGAAAPRPYPPLPEGPVLAANPDVVSLPIGAPAHAVHNVLTPPWTAQPQEVTGTKGRGTVQPWTVRFRPSRHARSRARSLSTCLLGSRAQAPSGTRTGQAQLMIPYKWVKWWGRTGPSSSERRTEKSVSVIVRAGEPSSWTPAVPKSTTGPSGTVPASWRRLAGNSQGRR